MTGGRAGLADHAPGRFAPAGMPGSIRSQEEIRDPAARRAADRRGLVARGAGNQKGGFGIGCGGHAHPALAAAEIGVFQQNEAEGAAEPGDRFVIVARKIGDERQPVTNGH